MHLILRSIVSYCNILHIIHRLGHKISWVDGVGVVLEKPRRVAQARIRYNTTKIWWWMIVIIHACSDIFPDFPDFPIHDEIVWEIDSNLSYRKYCMTLFCHTWVLLFQSFLCWGCCPFWFFQSPFMCFLVATGKTATTGLSVATWIGLYKSSTFVFTCGSILTYKFVVRLVSKLCASLPRFSFGSMKHSAFYWCLSLHWYFLNASMQLETYVVTLLLPRNYVIGTIAPEMHWVRLAAPLWSLFATNTAKCYDFKLKLDRQARPCET